MVIVKNNTDKHKASAGIELKNQVTNKNIKSAYIYQYVPLGSMKIVNRLLRLASSFNIKFLGTVSNKYRSIDQSINKYSNGRILRLKKGLNSLVIALCINKPDMKKKNGILI